jgi:hypothetical protein
MSPYIEETEDIAAYWIGGAIFTAVAAVTAAVMAVGFGAIEGVNWLRHRS